MSELSSLLKVKTDENQLRKVPGIVESYDESTGYARVRLPTVNDIIHTFLNKSGEILHKGDNVQIWYFTQISAGFVGLRCGLPCEPTNSIKAKILVREEYDSISKDNETVYFVKTDETVNIYLGKIKII